MYRSKQMLKLGIMYTQKNCDGSEYPKLYPVCFSCAFSNLFSFFYRIGTSLRKESCYERR